MNMTIRLAEEKDIPALKILYRELDQDGVRYQPEHFVLAERDGGYFLEIFQNSYEDILVAVLEGEIVGFSHVKVLESKAVSCLKPQKNVYIQDLAVSAPLRSKGIGSRLMEMSKEYGRERGAEFIRTSVFPKNGDGLRFYERNGFYETMKTIECPF